jgi:HrpA-like RNA helicase
MPPYDTPEMLRLSLDSVVLKVKMLGIKTGPAPGAPGAAGAKGAVKGAGGGAGGGAGAGAGAGAGGASPAAAAPAQTGTSAKAVLALSLQSPDVSNVDAALVKLAALGALTSADDAAAVTPFGRRLAAFPGDLALGKLVALGVALGVAADAIVLAAAAAAGEIFLMPHAAVAASPEDFAQSVARVVRAKWLFGRDALLGDEGAPGAPGAGGAGAGGWSEPLAARNA